MINQKNTSYEAGIVKLSSASRSLNQVEVISEKEAVEYSLDKKVINVDKIITTTGGTATLPRQEALLLMYCKLYHL